ncbi:MAG: AsmA family protein, partial [Bacteroidetes bacterium]|nr:AsmA family protein [Bacteroidota bacterium]
MLKKTLKITLIVLLVLLGVAFAAPFVFKGKIIKIAKEQINKKLTAAVDFSDLDISFFRHFPRVSVALTGLQVVGTEEFAKDTLISARNIDVALNLMSVIKGSDFKIYSINVNDPRIHVIVTKDGKANYNIMKPDTAAATPSSDTSSSFSMKLASYAIKNGYIKYDDATSGMSSEIVNLDHEGSGDFTADLFTLSTKTTADAVDFSYGGIPYLHRTRASIDADIQVDAKTSKYSFKTDKIAVNDLKLTAEGFFQLVNDSTYNMDIKYDAP